MVFTDDEVIAVAQSDPAPQKLTRAKIDGSPGAEKMTRAVITCFTASVAYRFDGVPSPSTNEYHLLAAGSQLTIDGYDNLVNAQFVLVSGPTTAKLFVSYAS